MISEGPCDTEDADDAENSALPSHKINDILKKYSQIENDIYISQFLCFYCIFYQINTKNIHNFSNI